MMGNKTERSTKKRVIFHLSAAFIFLLVALFDNTDLVLGARKKAGDANAPTGRGRGKQVKVKSEDDNNSTPSNRGRSAGRGKALVKPEPEPSSDGAEEVDDTNTIFADLQKRTLEPQSKIDGIDNKDLRNQWIALAVENVDNLEEKVKIMKGIKVTKLKDILQHELDSNRIDEIFEEYKQREGVWKYYYPDPYYVGRAMCELCRKSGQRISSTCAKSTSAMADHLRGSYHRLNLEQTQTEETEEQSDHDEKPSVSAGKKRKAPAQASKEGAVKKEKHCCSKC